VIIAVSISDEFDGLKSSLGLFNPNRWRPVEYGTDPSAIYAVQKLEVSRESRVVMMIF